jgi:hypothetical protein
MFRQVLAHDHALELVRHVGDGRDDELRHAQRRRQKLPEREYDRGDQNHRNQLQTPAGDPRRRRQGSARGAVSGR